MEPVGSLLDEGSFVPFADSLAPADPLGFPGYRNALEKARAQRAANESVVCGAGTIAGIAVEHAGFDAAMARQREMARAHWAGSGEAATETLWFELNLVMLFFSIGFLTDGWSPRLRLIAFPLALFFLPVLGALSVGQYDFPVLLGISLLIYSLRRESVVLTTLGVVLLTFKPHIGALILLSALGWLVGSRSGFGRRALRSIILAGIFLFLVGFLADPAWVINYPNMLLNYQGEGNVSSCSECANIPVFVSRWVLDGSLSQAAALSVLLLFLLIGLFLTTRKILIQMPELLLTSALLITLLASPYLYNYDFILLLVPFAVIASGNITQKIIVLICHFVTTFALAVYGRNGNIALLIAALILTVMIFLRANDSLKTGKPLTRITTIGE